MECRVTGDASWRIVAVKATVMACQTERVIECIIVEQWHALTLIGRRIHESVHGRITRITDICLAARITVIGTLFAYGTGSIIIVFLVADALVGGRKGPKAIRLAVQTFSAVCAGTAGIVTVGAKFNILVEIAFKTHTDAIVHVSEVGEVACLTSRIVATGWAVVKTGLTGCLTIIVVFLHTGTGVGDRSGKLTEIHCVTC